MREFESEREFEREREREREFERESLREREFERERDKGRCSKQFWIVGKQP